jgi:hypothetical protein
MSAIVEINGGRVLGAGGYLFSTGTSGTSPTNLSFVPPTQNTDGSAITPGEITGYEVGIRMSGGSPGTYPLLYSIPGLYAASALFATIIPTLGSGIYFSAIRSLGPIDSAWSAETSFTV